MSGFGEFLKKAFPAIAVASQALPFGPMVASLVGPALGLASLKPDDIETQIAAVKDPAVLEKLKEIDANLKITLEKMGFDNIEELERIAANDRANARIREETVKDKIPAALAISVTIGFFSLLWLMAFHDVPVQEHDILMTMVGVLGTAWMGIITYYFGSSAGSAQKGDALAKIAQKD